MEKQLIGTIYITESGTRRVHKFYTLKSAARFLHIYPEENVIELMNVGWIYTDVGERYKIDYVNRRE